MNKKNLELLKKGLLENREIIELYFEMEQYFSRKLEEVILPMSHYEENCGAHCCLLGWATRMEGLAPKRYHIGDNNIIRFTNYCEDYFDVDAGSWLWHYLFGSDWAEHDNTFEGAIERLENVINGVVDDYNAEEFIPFNLFLLNYN